jgi:hypothetical protein
MIQYSRLMPGHANEVLFRSRDGEEYFARDSGGSLKPLPAGLVTGWRGDERHRQLADSLAQHGLWRHLDEEQRAAARRDVATGCPPLDFDVLYGAVQFFADGESIAEHGVGRFLHELGPGLARLGLAVSVSDVAAGDSYVVEIDGVRCTVWERTDWDNGVDVWAQATIRPLAVVNTLLASLTKVRAHTLYAGLNHGFALLIEPGIVDAMRASGLFVDSELPTLAS